MSRNIWQRWQMHAIILHCHMLAQTCRLTSILSCGVPFHPVWTDWFLPAISVVKIVRECRWHTVVSFTHAHIDYPRKTYSYWFPDMCIISLLPWCLRHLVTHKPNNALTQKTSPPNLSKSEITSFCDDMYPPVIKRGNGKSSVNKRSMATSPDIHIPLPCFIKRGLTIRTNENNHPIPRSYIVHIYNTACRHHVFGW